MPQSKVTDKNVLLLTRLEKVFIKSLMSIIRYCTKRRDSTPSLPLSTSDHNIPGGHKEPQGNKDLQASLALAKIHKAIKQTLNMNDVHSSKEEDISFQEEHFCIKIAKYHMDEPEDYWKNVFLNR